MLFTSVAIGQSNYFGFCFTTLNWKPPLLFTQFLSCNNFVRRLFVIVSQVLLDGRVIYRTNAMKKGTWKNLHYVDLTELWKVKIKLSDADRVSLRIYDFIFIWNVLLWFFYGQNHLLLLLLPPLHYHCCCYYYYYHHHHHHHHYYYYYYYYHRYATTATTNVIAIGY